MSSLKFSQAPKPKTEKQIAQWKRFNRLGQLTSLAAWIGPKVAEIIKTGDMEEYQKITLLNCADNLVFLLKEEAKRQGWKPK